VLKLTENVAAALWAADLINNFTGQGAEGMSSRALEQGGIGLLLTVLIISVPPMAAMFFQGTMGSFLAYSQFTPANRPGPQGQSPGFYGNSAAQAYATQQTTQQHQSPGAFGNTATTPPTRAAGTTSPQPIDSVRPYSGPSPGGRA
jgi:type IV secretion system protein VirB6